MNTPIESSKQESPTEEQVRGVGRRDYAERKAAKIARLEARAAKAREDGESRISQARRIGDMIPMGQPILVGHHSEGRHRRDIARIQNGYTKGFEALKQADDLEHRASVAESNSAISSDDPEALVRLREKLSKIERAREQMKLCNATIRKHAKSGPDAQVAALVALGWFGEARARDLLKPDFCGRIGFADFELTNTGAEIRRIKARIAGLETLSTQPVRAPETIGDVTIDEGDNRVRIRFPGKPAAEVRTDLKRSGFRFAPSEGAWQRQASNAAWYEARRIVSRFSAEGLR